MRHFRRSASLKSGRSPREPTGKKEPAKAKGFEQLVVECELLQPLERHSVQAIGSRTEGPVFLSPTGKAWRVENLSRTYSRLRDLAGLPRVLVLYLARHECGTRICRLKGIEYARRLLGHTSISTTQRYMHLNDQELAEAQDMAG